MLSIENISVNIARHQILHKLSLTVNPGEVIGLCGANGSGKTTLMKAIMGLLQLSSGDIRLGSSSIVGLPTYMIRQLGIGYLPQNAPVFPKLTVEQNLKVALNKNHPKKSERLSIFKQTGLQECLAELMNTRCGLLSRGQKQMVSLSMVLGGVSDVLLLDEPFAPLSSEVKNVIAETIDLITRRSNTSVLIVEHDAIMVGSIGDVFYELSIDPQGSNIYTLKINPIAI